MKNKNKKIPWWMPEIGPKEYDLLKKVLDNNFTNQGPMTELLEKKVCELLYVKYAVATTSGTVALFLALKAAGVGKGDEVIVPDVTFIATANAVTLCGAKVVLVDIDPHTLMIDTEKFKRAITKKTKAVIPVHISGRPASMKEILHIAKESGISVVEDAAEAFMSFSDGKYLGTFGLAGCFSFSPNKTITSGQGGMLVTNDEAIYRRAKELKNQGVFERLSGGDDMHETVGFNFKFTDLQAAVALGQLSYLKKRLVRMKRNHDLYKKHLAGVKGISIFKSDTKKGIVPQWTDAVVERRDELDTYLRSKNIDCRKFWFPLHAQKPYKQSDVMFIESAKIIPKALWFPSAFTMTDKDVYTVCREIKNFFNK